MELKENSLEKHLQSGIFRKEYPQEEGRRIAQVLWQGV
jgi:hypothetical protein